MTRNQEFHGHSMFIPWVAAFTVIDCDPFYQAHSNANFLCLTDHFSGEAMLLVAGGGRRGRIFRRCFLLTWDRFFFLPAKQVQLQYADQAQSRISLKHCCIASPLGPTSAATGSHVNRTNAKHKFGPMIWSGKS